LLLVLLASSDAAAPAASYPLALAERARADADRALAPIPRSPPAGRAPVPSTTSAALGFLAGGAAVAGGGWALLEAYDRLPREKGDDGEGAAPLLLSIAYGALVASPLAGTFVADRGRGSPGFARAWLNGTLVHVAGLAGAVADHRGGAVGPMLATDLVVAPWSVARELRAAREKAEPPSAFALPVGEPGLAPGAGRAGLAWR
jgi:hypothetical protein